MLSWSLAMILNSPATCVQHAHRSGAARTRSCKFHRHLRISYLLYCALQQYELYNTLLWSHSNATSQPVTLLLVQGL